MIKLRTVVYQCHSAGNFNGTCSALSWCELSSDNLVRFKADSVYTRSAYHLDDQTGLTSILNTKTRV